MAGFEVITEESGRQIQIRLLRGRPQVRPEDASRCFRLVWSVPEDYVGRTASLAM